MKTKIEKACGDYRKYYKDYDGNKKITLNNIFKFAEYVYYRDCGSSSSEYYFNDYYAIVFDILNHLAYINLDRKKIKSLINHNKKMGTYFEFFRLSDDCQVQATEALCILYASYLGL